MPAVGLGSQYGKAVKSLQSMMISYRASRRRNNVAGKGESLPKILGSSTTTVRIFSRIQASWGVGRDMDSRRASGFVGGKRKDWNGI
jgi:hypothetical protein